MLCLPQPLFQMYSELLELLKRKDSEKGFKMQNIKCISDNLQPH